MPLYVQSVYKAPIARNLDFELEKNPKEFVFLKLEILEFLFRREDLVDFVERDQVKRAL